MLISYIFFYINNLFVYKYYIRNLELVIINVKTSIKNFYNMQINIIFSWGAKS